MNKVLELNRYDMKVIEGYITNIDKLRYRLKVRKLELLDNPIIDNPGGGKSNLPGDPVNREVTLCLTDDYYNNLEKIIRAIEKVYDESDDDVKELCKLNYWEPKLHLDTWEKKAKHFYTSKTTLLRVRERFLRRIAEEMDYINSDF